MGAQPMGRPGCPDFAFSIASADKILIALIVVFCTSIDSSPIYFKKMFSFWIAYARYTHNTHNIINLKFKAMSIDRRDFLKISAIGLAGAAVMNSCVGNAKTECKKKLTTNPFGDIINVDAIGLGRQCL